MKKLFIVVAVGLSFISCEKENVVSASNESNLNEQTITTATESSKNKELTIEDISIYFGLEKGQNVYEAINYATLIDGEKEINGKKITVNKTTVIEKNEEEGYFTFKLEGKINDIAFIHEFKFNGFAKKPSPYYMATRANVRWKYGSNYLQEFDFDSLYLLNKKEKYTAQYLSKWVEFYSTTPEGENLYFFTLEDIKETVISDIEFTKNPYSGGQITFVIAYKGIKGKSVSRPSLQFNPNEYYSNMMQYIDNSTGKYYMDGVYQHIDMFYGQFFKYDSNKFYVELGNHKTKDNQKNSIAVTFSINAIKDNREVAVIDKKITGFKPLTDLKDELIIAQSSELIDYMSKRLKKYSDGNVKEIILKYPISNWIKKAQIGIRREGGVIMLTCETKSLMNGNSIVDLWLPQSSKISNMDIYLENPHFEIVSALKENNRLKLDIELTNVNETSLEGVIIPLEVII